MFRTIVLAAALGAVALPAFAATAVTINVAGLDAKSTQAAIFHAAQAACRTELATETDLVRHYVWADCVHDAVAGADAKLASMGGLASR